MSVLQGVFWFALAWRSCATLGYLAQLMALARAVSQGGSPEKRIDRR